MTNYLIILEKLINNHLRFRRLVEDNNQKLREILYKGEDTYDTDIEDIDEFFEISKQRADSEYEDYNIIFLSLAEVDENQFNYIINKAKLYFPLKSEASIIPCNIDSLLAIVTKLTGNHRLTKVNYSSSIEFSGNYKIKVHGINTSIVFKPENYNLKTTTVASNKNVPKHLRRSAIQPKVTAEEKYANIKSPRVEEIIYAEDGRRLISSLELSLFASEQIKDFIKREDCE